MPSSRNNPGGQPRLAPLVTPDGRYLLVRGRLWRASNPGLSDDVRQDLVDELMSARRAVAAAQRTEGAPGLRRARSRVDAAKRGLGERGPVWWTDGAPDLNRRMAGNTDYADWAAAASPDDNEPAAPQALGHRPSSAKGHEAVLAKFLPKP